MAKMKKEMKMGKKSKKAVFFTLAIFLLVTTVLSLSILIFNFTYKDSSERTIELISFGRISDLSASVEKSIIRIFNANLNSSFSDFSQQIQNFETFAENSDENINLDLTPQDLGEIFGLTGTINVTLQGFEGGRINAINLTE